MSMITGFTAAVEVGHLQHHLLAVSSGDDPFGEALAHAWEDVRQAGALVPSLGLVGRVAQRGIHGAGGGLHAVFLVREQVDILGGSADHPMGKQRVAAAQREPISGRRAERDTGYLAVQPTDRHQAGIAAARSTG